MPGQPDHPHVVAEVLAAELRADAEPPGQLEYLLFELEIAEPMPGGRTGHRQGVEVVRGRVFGGLERVLRACPADHDREVVGGAGGRAEGPDLLLEKGEQALRAEHRLGLLVEKRLVRRAPALGHEQELVRAARVGVDLDLGGQVAARVALVPHGQRRKLGVPQVERRVRLVHPAADVLRVAAVGQHVLAAFAHHDGRPGVLAHREHPAGRDGRVLEQVKGDEAVVWARLRVVEDAAELRQVRRPQQVGDVGEGGGGQGGEHGRVDVEKISPERLACGDTTGIEQPVFRRAGRSSGAGRVLGGRQQIGVGEFRHDSFLRRGPEFQPRACGAPRSDRLVPPRSGTGGHLFPDGRQK